MKPKQKMRSGEIVPATGTWISRCMRDGCNAVERLSLREGVPAPPCRRCLNPAWLRFLHAPAPVELSAEPAPPAEVLNPEAAPTSIRTGEIVPASGTWSIRCTGYGCCAVEKKIQHKGAWADPCSRCHGPALLSFLPEPAPATSAAPTSAPIVEAPMQPFDMVTLSPREKEPRTETAAPDPAENKKVEEPPIAAAEPTLMQRLTGGRRTPANAPSARK